MNNILYTPANPDGKNGTLNDPIETGGIPVIKKEYEIPAREGRAVVLTAGQKIKITNPHGNQVCDFFAQVENSPSEFLSMEHTRTTLGRIYVKTGDQLVTNRRRAIVEILEDTSPSIHDTLIACCDQQRYEQLGAQGYHDNCADNFRMSLAAIGRTPTHVPSPLNIWMNIPVAQNGDYEWAAPVSKPGDHIILRALLPCIVVMSACPQDMTNVNGLGQDPVELSFQVQP